MLKRSSYRTWTGIRDAPWGPTIVLHVEKCSGRDDISWDVLQQLKDKILGEEVTDVEVYPP